MFVDFGEEHLIARSLLCWAFEFNHLSSLKREDTICKLK